MWTRWMLVQEDPDSPSVIHLARGVPARWFNNTPFGISRAPTRQGLVSFAMSGSAQGSTGWVTFNPNAGQQPAPARKSRVVSLRVGKQGSSLKVSAQGATVVSVDAEKGTALFSCNGTTFNFTAAAFVPTTPSGTSS
jgi:hypothetical protein